MTKEIKDLDALHYVSQNTVQAALRQVEKCVIPYKVTHGRAYRRDMSEEEENKQEDNLITIDELSRKFHVSTKTLRRLTKYGQLRPIRLIRMGPLRYTPEEVERFLNENTINRPEESQEQ